MVTRPLFSKLIPTKIQNGLQFHMSFRYKNESGQKKSSPKIETTFKFKYYIIVLFIWNETKLTLNLDLEKTI